MANDIEVSDVQRRVTEYASPFGGLALMGAYDKIDANAMRSNREKA